MFEFFSFKSARPEVGVHRPGVRQINNFGRWI